VVGVVCVWYGTGRESSRLFQEAPEATIQYFFLHWTAKSFKNHTRRGNKLQPPSTLLLLRLTGIYQQARSVAFCWSYLENEPSNQIQTSSTGRCIKYNRHLRRRQCSLLTPPHPLTFFRCAAHELTSPGFRSLWVVTRVPPLFFYIVCISTYTTGSNQHGTPYPAHAKNVNFDINKWLVSHDGADGYTHTFRSKIKKNYTRILPPTTAARDNKKKLNRN